MGCCLIIVTYPDTAHNCVYVVKGTSDRGQLTRVVGTPSDLGMVVNFVRMAIFFYLPEMWLL